MKNILSKIEVENVSKKTQIIIRLVTILLGICCIFLSGSINTYLPYLVGALMLVFSCAGLVVCIKRKEYKTLETKATATAIIGIVISIVIILQGENSISLIGIVWGLIGLKKGISGINVSLYNHSHGKKYRLELLHASAEILLAIVLILNPFEKIEIHIIILGFEMILNTMKYMFKDKLYKIDDNLI